MNRFLLLGLGAALLGCNSLSEPPVSGMTLPATVLWLEWPATVAVDQPYRVRLVIPPLCDDGHLEMRQLQSAHVVLFEARWTDVRPSDFGCEPAGPIYQLWTVEALRIGGSPRSLELQGTGSAIDSWHHFGTLTLVPNDATDSTLAAGYTRFFSDAPGCYRMQPAGTPIGLPPSPPSYQLSGSPPDTSTSRRFWVEGYLERAKTACAQGAADSLVFHLFQYSTSPN